ncbi:MAG: PAS domain S-box protein [Chlorobium sp.]|jgi:PAS domain S-box-containing protein|nr:PAS domain S-box protein [Chlorobium sp.]
MDNTSEEDQHQQLLRENARLKALLRSGDEQPKALDGLNSSEDQCLHPGSLLTGGSVYQFSWKNKLQGPVTFVSSNIQQLLGYTSDEFTSGQISYGSLIYPDDLATFVEELHRSIERNIDSFEQEYRLRKKDGTVFRVCDYTIVLRDKKSNTLCYEGYIIDASTKTCFEPLFDTIDDFLFIVDRDGLVIHSNEAVKNRLGYSLDELAGKNIEYFFGDDQQKEIHDKIEGLLFGRNTSFRVPLLTRSGTAIPAETTIAKGNWNNRTVICCNSRDISDQIRQEQALIESERRFRDLTEMLPLPLFEADVNGMVTYTNSQGVEAFGYTPEDLHRGVSVFKCCIPEESGIVSANFESMKAGSRMSTGNEYTALRKNNTTFPALLYSTPIIRNDLFAGARAIVIDLTKLKKAESVLGNSRLQERMVRELQSLIDNIPGAVYRVNSRNETTMLSMTGDFLQDYTREEFEKELFPSMAIIHPEDRDLVLTSNQSLRSVKRSEALVYRIVTKNGSVRWVEDRKTSAFSPDGMFLGIDGILFDITERIKAEKNKQLLESRLRKTQRLETIGTLAGGIAHDFNNILTPLLGYAEMGLSSLSSESPLYDYFSEIIQASERAKNLIAQILTFSRPGESNPAVVSVQDIIAESLKLLRPSIPSTITIVQDLDFSCRNILADPSQIHQVIVNLCTNAFQAMEESGGVMTIGLREITPDKALMAEFPELHEHESYLQLSISDTGKGMDEKTMERIFEPFFTTKSGRKGTGLGLSVVHGIISSYNGHISVVSRPEKGTSFRVYLPVCNKKALTDSARVDVAKGKGCILFVDDELATIRIMERMMTRIGFKIQSCSSPLQALELFRKNPETFDLVITDLTMPEMTGIALAGELRKISSRLPIILMTGYGEEIETMSSLSLVGICKLLKKPVNMAELISAVKEVILHKKA